VLGSISPQGTLPIDGIDGLTAAGARPLVQRLPTIDQWNATIQRQVTSTLNITASYIGNKELTFLRVRVHLITRTKLQLVRVPISWTALRARVHWPDLRQLNHRPIAVVSSSTVSRHLRTQDLLTQTRRAKCFQHLLAARLIRLYYGNDASNKYNALQVKAEKRVSSGLQFLAHYTFSHAYAYDSSYYSVNPKVAWGPNPYNRNQVFVANTIYELPVGTGKKFMSDAGRAMNLVVGGWQVTNTLTYGTGLPFTPSIAECGAIADAGPCRPNIANGASNISTGVTNSGGNTYWFTPVAPLSYNADLTPGNAGVDSCTFARPVSGPYSLPGCGQIGNAGFNSMRGPHAFFDDMAISKTFILTERFRAQFRFDAYNVFNHPVLAVPGNTCVDCAGNSNAGQITDIEADSAPGSPVGMRQLQFGVRLTF